MRASASAAPAPTMATPRWRMRRPTRASARRSTRCGRWGSHRISSYLVVSRRILSYLMVVYSLRQEQVVILERLGVIDRKRQEMQGKANTCADQLDEAETKPLIGSTALKRGGLAAGKPARPARSRARA